ncbi:HET-domain-containing protein [Ophiobolus disseminans]|uniref:HET-domain-containing protein n=1 Tax=Ophiobolus disseminans TaxID=1469910 RepID=A0A6A6ZJA6_9PLEO|nr:HET-domain-containing protein [Ophiobolus disseminans]
MMPKEVCIPEDELCEECRQIDWNRLAGGQLQFNSGKNGVVLYGIGVEMRKSMCALCRIVSGAMNPQNTSTGAQLHIAVDPMFKRPILRISTRDAAQPLALSAFSDDEDPSMLVPQFVTPNAVDFDVVRQWVSSCANQHSISCLPTSRSQIPGLKVIDCHTEHVVALPDAHCPYVALSYVWGTPRKDDEASAAYPQTIQDSMTVTLALGFRYIWVDRYCIDQDNDVERHQQICMMDRIYSDARLTIIAAAGSDAGYGLPGVSTRGRLPQQQFRTKGLTFLQLYNPIVSIQESIWASRGWTFQEGFLSHRRLIFTDQEVAFLCNKAHHQESVRGNGLDRVNIPELRNFMPAQDSAFVGAARQRVLRQYSQRSLRYDTDAINACEGIFKALRTPHIWGIPAQRDSPDLCWRSDTPGRRRNTFPTWSWASSEGAKSFYLYPAVNVYHVEVMSATNSWQTITDYVHTARSTPAPPVGKVLRRTGVIVKPRFMKPRPTGLAKTILLPLLGTARTTFALYLDTPDVDLDNIVALAFYKGRSNALGGKIGAWFIILKPVGTFYKRVGITESFEWDHYAPDGLDKKADWSWIEGPETRTIYMV